MTFSANREGVPGLFLLHPQLELGSDTANPINVAAAASEEKNCIS